MSSSILFFLLTIYTLVPLPTRLWTSGRIKLRYLKVTPTKNCIYRRGEGVSFTRLVRQDRMMRPKKGSHLSIKFASRARDSVRPAMARPARHQSASRPFGPFLLPMPIRESYFLLQCGCVSWPAVLNYDSTIVGLSQRVPSSPAGVTEGRGLAP